MSFSSFCIFPRICLNPRKKLISSFRFSPFLPFDFLISVSRFLYSEVVPPMRRVWLFFASNFPPNPYIAFKSSNILFQKIN